jgi:hypothetical protein
MIYGLLGLAITDGHEITVDYSLSVAQIYTEFTKNHILKSGKLDVLARVERPDSKFALPSWVPDWSQCAGDHAFVDNLRLPDRFTASQDRPTKVVFSGEGYIMTTKVVLLGYITTMGERTDMISHTDHFGVIVAFHSWWKIFGVEDNDLERAESFAKTSCWDKLSHKAHAYDFPLSHLHLALLGSSVKLSLQVAPDLEMSGFLRDWRKNFLGDSGPDQQTALSQQWMTSCAVKFWDRRFFMSNYGTPGLAPNHSKENDIICIPLGCRMPVILRQVEAHYILVGAAYFEGFMRGQAIDLLDRRKL